MRSGTGDYVAAHTFKIHPNQEISQTHILSHRLGHRLLISGITVSLQPPHSVTQQLLMACAQQQPVSAALHTALIKCSALEGLKIELELERAGSKGIVILSTSIITPPRHRGLGLPT